MPAGLGWQLPGQGIHTRTPDQAESCPGRQVPEQRAVPWAAGPRVQNRIMTHGQAEAT